MQSDLSVREGIMETIFILEGHSRNFDYHKKNSTKRTKWKSTHSSTFFSSSLIQAQMATVLLSGRGGGLIRRIVRAFPAFPLVDFWSRLGDWRFSPGLQSLLLVVVGLAFKHTSETATVVTHVHAAINTMAANKVHDFFDWALARIILGGLCL